MNYKATVDRVAVSLESGAGVSPVIQAQDARATIEIGHSPKMDWIRNGRKRCNQLQATKF